jgi:hypothetical protein
MPDSIIPVKASLSNEAGKEIANATINVPNSHTFSDLPAGKYTVTYIIPEGYTLTKPNPSHHTLTGDKNTLEITIGLKDVSPPLPIAIIPVAVLSMVLLANLSLVESFFSPKKTPSLEQEQVAIKSSPRDNRFSEKLTPEVESKLRQCLKKNLKRLLNIPSLSSLIELLNNEEESSKTEFQEQAILLYKKVKELRATIEDCDPTLIQEIIAAEDNKNEQREPQFTVMVMAKMVNVRAGQSLDYEVIGQIPYGTIVQVDSFTFAKLSQQQLLAIKRNEGWYPVILSDGRKGYIYSLYIRRLS